MIETLVRILYDDGKCATVASPWIEVGGRPQELVEEQMNIIRDTLQSHGYTNIHKSATIMNQKQQQAVASRANRAEKFNHNKGNDDGNSDTSGQPKDTDQ